MSCILQRKSVCLPQLLKLLGQANWSGGGRDECSTFSALFAVLREVQTGDADRAEGAPKPISDGTECARGEGRRAGLTGQWLRRKPGHHESTVFREGLPLHERAPAASSDAGKCTEAGGQPCELASEAGCVPSSQPRWLCPRQTGLCTCPCTCRCKGSSCVAACVLLLPGRSSLSFFPFAWTLLPGFGWTN